MYVLVLPESSELQQSGSCLMMGERIRGQDGQQAGKIRFIKEKVHTQEKSTDPFVIHKRDN